MNTIKSILFSSQRKESEENPTVRLMKVMKFGGKDLDLNREGLLSDLQKRRLNQDFFWRVFLAGIVVVLSVGVAWDSDRKYPFKEYGSPYVPILSILAVMCIVGFSYALYRHLKNITRGTVLAFTGCAKRYAVGNYAIMFINYEDRTERVYGMRAHEHGAFMEGETYTVYSASFDQNHVLSAEHTLEDMK